MFSSLWNVVGSRTIDIVETRVYVPIVRSNELQLETEKNVSLVGRQYDGIENSAFTLATPSYSNNNWAIKNFEQLKYSFDRAD